MLRLLFDEDFSFPVVRGFRDRCPGLDGPTIQELSMHGTSDPEVLAFARAEGRTVVSHDSNTMTDALWSRISRGEATSGLIIVSRFLTIGETIDQLELIVTARSPKEFDDDPLVYVPLR